MNERVSVLVEDRLDDLVADWVAAGVITPEQAAVMQADVHRDGARDRTSGGGSLAIEALGYLGGVVVVVAVTAIAAQQWDDLATGWRLLVVGAGATVPLLAGLAVPAHLADVGVRLRAALWVVSTVAFAGFMVLLTDQALGLGDHAVAVTSAAGATAWAASLWRLRPTMAQQAVAMVAAAVTAATAIDALEVSGDLPGVGVLATGVLWSVLAWRQVLRPARLGIAAGAAMAVFGAMTTSGADAGTVLVLVTVASVVGLAVVRRDLLLLAVGTVGALQAIPAALTRWFPDSEAVPYVLLVVGAGLVLSAVRIARRRPGARRS